MVGSTVRDGMNVMMMTDTYNTKSICYHSYRAEAFNEQDIFKYGPHGIKLVPYSASKRKWFFRAFVELGQLEWIEVDG